MLVVFHSRNPLTYVKTQTYTNLSKSSRVATQILHKTYLAQNCLQGWSKVPIQNTFKPKHKNTNSLHRLIVTVRIFLFQWTTQLWLRRLTTKPSTCWGTLAPSWPWPSSTTNRPRPSSSRTFGNSYRKRNKYFQVKLILLFLFLLLLLLLLLL